MGPLEIQNATIRVRDAFPMPGIENLWIALPLGLLSVVLTGATIWGCRRLGVTADRPQGVQRVHRHWAPRLGGLPILLTLLAGTVVWTDMPDRHLAVLLLVCALPAFLAGVIEDLWRQVGPRMRLMATFVAAWLAFFLIDGRLTHVDLPGFDFLLQNTLFAFVFTAFAVGGVAHSINIIDGFNGLSAFYCVICFAAFFIVGTIVGDGLVQGLSLLFCAALLGFLVWNFPFGRVFLGDGGAYLLGFGLGELSVLLVSRNPEVSPWFCFLLLAYPIWDTLYSSYRREVKRRVAWTCADAMHLHHLIYRRLVRPFRSCRRERTDDRVIPNSMTSLYVWALGLMCAVPAVLFWNSTPALAAFSVAFIVSYGLLYRRIVTLRAPRMLRHPARRLAAPSTVPASADTDDTLAAK